MKRIFVLIILIILSIFGTKVYIDDYQAARKTSVNLDESVKLGLVNIKVDNIIKESNDTKNNEIMKIDGLVRVLDVDNTIVVDLKYATNDNFVGKAVYSFKTCLLREETAKKLANANKILKKKGFKIKIYDGYRPKAVQQIFWDTIHDDDYIANPAQGGSVHSKGGAVDITMVNEKGDAVEMPSKFDDLTPKGSRKSSKMSKEAKKNLDVLTSAMVESGFNPIQTEWWHYNDKEAKNYKIVDVDPKLFEDDHK